MYRTYENPHTLEQELQELKARREEIWQRAAAGDDRAEYEAEDIEYSIYELENRIRFAWEDDEAEAEGWD